MTAGSSMERLEGSEQTVESSLRKFSACMMGL